MKLMHGDIVANKSTADCGKFFFVLNPCRLTTTISLDEEEADQQFCQVVLQSLEDKGDFRYVSYQYFKDGSWYLVNNKFQNKE